MKIKNLTKKNSKIEFFKKNKDNITTMAATQKIILTGSTETFTTTLEDEPVVTVEDIVKALMQAVEHDISIGDNDTFFGGIELGDECVDLLRKKVQDINPEHVVESSSVGITVTYSK
jgi:hypothetical protein